jgi:hypothetical protein
MKLFEFKRLIERFTVPFILERPMVSDEEREWDNKGKEIPKALIEPENAKGALIPLQERTIYKSGGALTEADRQLYSLDHTIPKKSRITYKGVTYSVENKTPHEDYADFSLYPLKAVTTLT